jgi:hypothetical protein
MDPQRYTGSGFLAHTNNSLYSITIEVRDSVLDSLGFYPKYGVDMSRICSTSMKILFCYFLGVVEKKEEGHMHKALWAQWYGPKGKCR